VALDSRLDRRLQVNDFSIKLANVNGTGSASANSLLMQAIFRMGIPVSGKNLFPSNIQGLPTWYEIRVNKSGYTARALEYDLVVAMNAQTYAQDINDVRQGGYVVYDSSWPLDPDLMRDDVTFLGIPLAKMCLENFKLPRERILMKNIAYAGAIVAMVGIDVTLVADLLGETFARNEALKESNQKALRLGYDYAIENLDCPLPFYVEPMDANGSSILINGNMATALGCLYAGATVAGWYPITPATAVMDNFIALCNRYRRETVPSDDPDVPESKKNNYLIIQAEDEIAAIGMVLGASWSGARAFTSTSGPGISLMNELLGLAYYTEIPAVIVDVQRTGPSTGMPTRTQQADILLCAYASHGDTKHILLFPANPNECFDFAVRSFDLAEQFQTPVFLLSDLDIGMNDWVVPELQWDDNYVWDRGPVLNDEDLAALTSFFRYDALNEDFVATRTLPGSDEKGAYFIRGSGHDRYGHYTENPPVYQEVVDRLKLKHAASAKHVPEPVIERREGATVGVITVGSCDLAVREALDELADAGVPADFMRVRGFPFIDSVREFVDAHEHCFVVEQNRDAQLRSLIAIETGVSPETMQPVLAYGGFPLSAQQVVEAVLAKLEN
jgi:2-oxoglutarate/2-oxoacid ferredoxin oxidoreductase subunit alpha